MKVRFERGEMHEHLSLIIDRAAPVDIPIANGALERRREPEFERFGGLDIVVAVNEHGGFRGIAPVTPVRERRSIGLQ